VVLVCNDFAAMDALLARWSPPDQPELVRRWSRMTGVQSLGARAGAGQA
jgi:hypothetical protein